LLADKSDVESFAWSPNGQLIIYTARRQLHLLGLDGQIQPLVTPFKVLEIYQALDNNQLLLSVIHQKQVKTILLDINSKQTKVLYSGEVNWAQLTADNKLYITDNDMQFNQIVNGAIEPIAELKQLKAWSSFFIKKGKMIILDEDKNLWQYELQNKLKKQLLKQVKNIKYMTDIDLNNERFLATQVVSAKKEIVMFQH